MNTRDAGAGDDSPTSVRPTVRVLFLGRRFRVHRLVALTLAVALILVIAYVITVSTSSALEKLPGVTRVDREQRTVALSPKITPAEVRQVFAQTQQFSESWTLILGPAALATGAAPRPASTDGHDPVALLHRLGTAELAEPAAIIVDAIAPRIDAEPKQKNRAFPLARTLITNLSADDAGAVDRLAVHGSPTVTVLRAALRRPAEADAVLALLERVPGLGEAVLGERTRARAYAADEGAADQACQAAREALGARTDIELTVEISPDEEAEEEAEIRAC
jgi:hypothetical protein